MPNTSLKSPQYFPADKLLQSDIPYRKIEASFKTSDEPFFSDFFFSLLLYPNSIATVLCACARLPQYFKSSDFNLRFVFLFLHFFHCNSIFTGKHACETVMCSVLVREMQCAVLCFRLFFTTIF